MNGKKWGRVVAARRAAEYAVITPLARTYDPVYSSRLNWIFSRTRFFPEPTALKVRTSVRPICEHCKVIKRRGVIRVICKRSPKHKQRQG